MASKLLRPVQIPAQPILTLANIDWQTLTTTTDKSLRRRLEDYRDKIHETLLTHCEADPATGCWVWTGPWQPRTGFGLIRILGRMALVHRVSLWIYRGAKLLFDLWDAASRVRHRPAKCKTPACFNPDHLELKRTGLALAV